MRLTSLADYAVVVMAAAARRPAGARLSAGLLAGETGVPLPTAQKLMGRLAVAGLLESARGTGGGFRLARAASGISLADVIEAIEGPIAMTNCITGSVHDCALEGSCRVKPHISVANDAVRGALQRVSLEQLACSPPQGPHQSTTLMGPKAGAQDGAEGWTPAFAGEQVR
jgi:FeS assembly SUF system regulator